jgi:antitoxin (DNA-binding transcriptional repressor) of toxin-antitoxin stability system
MSKAVSVTEVLRNFADYINRVAYRGERFVLVRGGRPVAELSPVPTGTCLGDLPDLLGGLPSLGREHAEEWAAELEAARQEVGEPPSRDPWES